MSIGKGNLDQGCLGMSDPLPSCSTIHCPREGVQFTFVKFLYERGPQGDPKGEGKRKRALEGRRGNRRILEGRKSEGGH